MVFHSVVPGHNKINLHFLVITGCKSSVVLGNKIPPTCPAVGTKDLGRDCREIDIDTQLIGWVENDIPFVYLNFVTRWHRIPWGPKFEVEIGYSKNDPRALGLG